MRVESNTSQTRSCKASAVRWVLWTHPESLWCRGPSCPCPHPCFCLWCSWDWLTNSWQIFTNNCQRSFTADYRLGMKHVTLLLRLKCTSISWYTVVIEGHISWWLTWDSSGWPMMATLSGHPLHLPDWSGTKPSSPLSTWELSGDTENSFVHDLSDCWCSGHVTEANKHCSLSLVI